MYDKDGKLNQWWTPTAIDKFRGKAECIQSQYGNYTVKEANMNVGKTNIDDMDANEGLKSNAESCFFLLPTQTSF